MGERAARRASQKKNPLRCGFFYGFGESMREWRICLCLTGSASGNDYVIKNVSLR